MVSELCRNYSGGKLCARTVGNFRIKRFFDLL